tara:strand:- start:22 stop:441 length:420 start_codon:yes stop_codon:yes gene_type:complete
MRLEHANICVHDIDGIIKFLRTAFPEFNIRHDEIGEDGIRWVHIGTDRTYIALEKATNPLKNKWIPYSGKPGVNHLAFEVENVDIVRENLNSAGYKESTISNNHPYRKRIYFLDPEGNDWEFVQYLSDNNNERNDYTHK